MWIVCAIKSIKYPMLSFCEDDVYFNLFRLCRSLRDGSTYICKCYTIYKDYNICTNNTRSFYILLYQDNILLYQLL